MPYDAESTSTTRDSCIRLHPEVPRPAARSRSFAVQRITTNLNQEKQMPVLPSLWLPSAWFSCDRIDSSSLKMPHTLHSNTRLIRHLAVRYNLARTKYCAPVINAWVGLGNWPRSNHCPCPKRCIFIYMLTSWTSPTECYRYWGPVQFLPHVELKCHPYWNIACYDDRTRA
jgi:hypothetical protein